MRGTWKDSTACFCRTANRTGLSKPCDNTSTVTRTPSVWEKKQTKNRDRTNSWADFRTLWRHIAGLAPHTHPVPGDGVVESVDGLVLTGHRVVVGDIKLCLFLNHILGEAHRTDATGKVGHTQPEQRRQSRSDPTTSCPRAAFMARLPAAPQHHCSLPRRLNEVAADT